MTKTLKEIEIMYMIKKDRLLL